MLPYKLVNWIYSWKNWLIRKIQMSMYSWLLNVLICAQNLCNFLLFQKSFQYPELRNGRINIKGKTGLEKYFGSIHDWTLIQLNLLKLPPVLNRKTLSIKENLNVNVYFGYWMLWFMLKPYTTFTDFKRVFNIRN